MDVMKKKQMLATLVMLSLLQGSVFAANQNIVIESQNDYDKYKNEYNNIVLEGGNNTISISGVNNDDDIIAGNTVSNKVTIAHSELCDIYGAYSDIKSANNNIITIDGSMVESVYGAKVNQYNDEIDCYTPVSAEDNYVTVTNNSTIYREIYGASVWYGDAYNNHLNISDTEFIGYTGGPGGAIYAGAQVAYGTVENNSVTITNCKAEGEFVGGVTVFGSAINNTVKIENLIPMVEEDLAVSNSSRVYVFGGQSSGNFLNENLDNYSNKPSAVQDNRIEIYGKNKIHGIYGGYGFAAPVPELVSINKNYVDIYGEVETLAIYGGYSCCTSGYDGIKVINNRITLFDGSKVEGIIIAGGSEEIGTEVRGNSINLQGSANVKNADLYGYAFDEYLGAVSSDKVSNNNLVIDKGWTGEAKSVQNFNNINFNNIVWQAGNNKAILTTNSGNLDGTNVSFTLQSGQKVNVGESMTLISSSTDFGTIANNGQSLNTTMGVAADVSATLEQTGNKVMATVDNIELNDQTMLVAENRAVAAAFVNQGTDLIADSLDTLSRDGKYGVKTFAAVQGNRSKYDVNSDIKINGWSTIVGVGSETEHNGGDFSWGVFYENGSGNYRTFNSFNNEYFRGDGSLVYNGGGIAARYENAHGVYTEGSLRAGMLKSDMDNALSDGENKYGYSSESEYYGAHIGIGQIIPLSESSDLDVYGKFFHTYTEGDSFKVDTDEFEFDSINSDRLRVGARLTTNKENKFSTYYGLAYEYEFNGDAEMRAAGMSAPTQSLQGSSYMAEIGLNYQPTPDSPWSFDLNMRGYAGEREGATFNVQATYTF